MEDSGPTASYIIFFVVLLVDIFFYSLGAAIRELGVRELSNQGETIERKKAERIYKIAVNPEPYINAVQTAVTIMNLLLGAMIYHIFSEKPAVMIIAGMVLLCVLSFFGVLLPAQLGSRYLLMFGIRREKSSEDVIEEEIISMVNEGHEQGVLMATEAEMITNIFEFGDKEAQDIMTNRTNILAIDRSMTLRDALEYMLNESKSRFPVYDENIDNVIGILHFRDAMRAHREERNLDLPVGDIEGLVRDVMFVPETKNIDDLFRDMQSTKTQMVIVVDEYGQTSGLIAMEDILEEIVGNIMDEYDEDEEHIEETENADEYIIEGITPLEELEKRFSISFREEEFETLNGFMISKMDKIPEENEKFSVTVDGYEFKILNVENRMIKSVLVTKLPEKEEVEEENTQVEEKENKQE